MNRNELITAVAQKSEMTKKDTERMLDSFTEVIREALVAGERIQMVNFGCFEVAERPARMGRNPQTGLEVHIPACKVPKFRPGKSLKEAVNE